MLWTRRQGNAKAPPAGGLAYFIAIGLGFMFVEMAMMQQLSIFLGHPIYSMVVVLAGLGAGCRHLGGEQRLDGVLQVARSLRAILPP